MTMCGMCSGSGKVTCPGCGGKGNKTRMTINGEVETLPCLVCGGSRRVRCDLCQGTGQIGTGPGGGSSAPRKRKSNEDVLEGRWNTKGGWYEFTKEGDHYSVTERGALGKTGSGTATLSSRTVTIQVRNVMGAYTLQFELDGDTLRGSMKVMGKPVPMVLTRG